MNNWKTLSSAMLLFAATTLSAAAEEANEPSAGSSGSELTLVVYQDPNCGCCGKWVEHMRAHGFTVENMPEPDLSARKQALGVPPSLWSCHTAVIGDYVIEGHVPAGDIKRLLAERPEGKGLAVPGMPVGSPGMEYGGRRQAFDVLLFDTTGNTTVFKHHPASG